MKYQISHFILKKSHNFSKSFNFRLYILLICEETYEKYFNISQILIKGGNTIKDVLILVPKNELVNTI